jgi:hypothetical protein
MRNYQKTFDIFGVLMDDNITDATFDYKKDFDGFYSKRKIL